MRPDRDPPPAFDPGDIVTVTVEGEFLGLRVVIGRHGFRVRAHDGRLGEIAQLVHPAHCAKVGAVPASVVADCRRMHTLADDAARSKIRRLTGLADHHELGV